MDIHALQTFIRTAELLHFGKASRACNLSPSALSRTIQRLESDLGHPLFIRDNRSVVLTQAGKRLLPYARNAIQEWQHFSESISQEEEICGSISIYASITAVYTLLPDLIESYRAKYPAVQLDLCTGAAEQAVAQVLSGEIDLAVTAEPNREQAQLEFMPLIETPLVFIIAKQQTAFSLTNGNRVDFTNTPLVLPQSGTARDRLDAWLKSRKITPSIATEVSGNEGLIAMVSLGTGVGVVPLIALDHSPFRHNVEIITNAPRLKPFVVGLCASRRSLKRPALRAIWELARERERMES